MQPTLTIAMNEKNPHQFTTFAFTRGFDGEGHWITKTSTPQMPANCIVPVILNQELTVLAKERGLTEQYNFSRSIPKPEKTVAVRGPSKPKAPKSGLMGGFNPFAVE